MAKCVTVNDTQERLKLLVCVAPGCRNSSVNNKNVTFHCFPGAHVGKLWQATLGTVASESSSIAAVCSQHFQDEDYFEEQYFEEDVKKFRRTLKPEAIPSVFSSPPPKTDTPQQRRIQIKDEDDDTEITPPQAEKSYKPRELKALTFFTQKFLELLKSCPDGLLDINQAIKALKISRRRIYDITNVLEGVYLLKKKSKNIFQWIGPPPREKQESLEYLLAEENKLDDIIKCTKQQIYDLYENILSNKYAYLTYEDIQNIPIFEDQTMFVIKAPRETMLEVAHPKEAFQMHIISTMGPVEVFGCTDDVDIAQTCKSQKSKFGDGDYSSLPLRGLSTGATSCKDNANHNTKSSNIFNSPSEPTQPLSQVPNIPCPKSSSVLPPQEDLSNSSAPDLPLPICIKEEINNLNITPDASINEPDHLCTDVQMTDLS